MNLLCPNCQKMLTVPEQYAGQLMKCPLCAGTFTVPALPPSAPPPPVPPPPPDVFGFKDPAAPAPSMPAPSSYLTPGLPPSVPPVPPPPPPPPPMPPGDYTHKASIWFSPKVIQFIPAAAVVLLFFLQFAPWVGFYLGSYSVVTQNAWGAAFATKPTEENDLKAAFQWTTQKEIDKAKEEKNNDFKPNWPEYSVLTIFYLLLYFPTAIITLACVVFPFVPLKLPPVVQGFLKWKWALALLINLLLFFILLLQLAFGFGMESGVKNNAKAEVDAISKARGDKDPMPQMQKDAMVSWKTSHVQTTTVVHVIVFLHLLVIVCALLMFWLNQREAFNKPNPELNLRW